LNQRHQTLPSRYRVWPARLRRLYTKQRNIIPVANYVASSPPPSHNNKSVYLTLAQDQDERLPP